MLNHFGKDYHIEQITPKRQLIGLQIKQFYL
jgi:hypothetical protein